MHKCVLWHRGCRGRLAAGGLFWAGLASHVSAALSPMERRAWRVDKHPAGVYVLPGALAPMKLACWVHASCPQGGTVSSRK